MTTTTNGTGADMILVDAQNGITVIPSSTPLTQLNYFDGKYLRAGDLQVEQDYLHSLVQLSNRAGGAGVVHGYNTVLSTTGDAGIISPGLAIDGDGRVLLLPVEQTLDLAKLVAALQTPAMGPGTAGSGDFATCATATAGGGTTIGTAPTPGLYLLTVGHLTGLCGDEDVYGQICADACVTSKNRRYRLEGVIFRARPITLDISSYSAKNVVPITAKFMRSVYASAYYADETTRVSRLISGAGLATDTWCLGAASACGSEVSLALFLRSSSGTQFLDAWSARRERIDPPARRYWAWRMAMRPWDVYLAQIFQFQCQLHDLLGPGGGGASPNDPCATERTIIGGASSIIARIEDYYAALSNALSSVPGFPALAAQAPSLAELQALKAQLDSTATAPPAAPDAGHGVLIGGGVVELPAAGYLPINNMSGETVNAQVRRYVGPGLDLRYCIVRPDFVAHALEQRQHMDRIPLLDGISDPNDMPEVDILVPNGKLAQTKATIEGREFVVQFQDSGNQQDAAGNSVPSPLLRGGARFRPSGGGYEGAAALISNPPTSIKGNQNQRALFIAASMNNYPFAVDGASETQVDLWVTTAEHANAINELNASIKYSVKQGPTPGPTPGTAIVTGNASVLYGQTKTLPGPVAEQKGGKIQLEVTLTRTDLGGGDFSLEARNTSDPNHSITLTWHQQSHQATLHIATDTVASADEQANVLETDNSASQRVQQALDFVVNTGLMSASWRADATAKLWPPPPSATGGVAVLPGLDWVLFCRRRDCMCNIDAQPAPSRSFQVWAIDLVEKSWDEATRKAILANPAQYAPTKIDVIDFPAASYELNNAAKAPQRWTAVIKDPGYVIQWAGIAMSGVPDASWLQSNRLDAYEAALASVAPSVPGAALREVLSYAPQGLSVPGTDGIVLLVIAQPKVPVYRLLPSNDGLRFLREPKNSAFTDKVASYLDLVPLALPRKSPDEKLKASWEAHRDGVPYGYIVLSNPKAQGIDQNRLAARAKDLVTELGGMSKTQPDMRTDSGAGWPVHGSDAVIVLLPLVQVIVYREQWHNASAKLVDRVKAPTEQLGVGCFRPDSNDLENVSDFTEWHEGRERPGGDFYVSSRVGDDSVVDSAQKERLVPRVMKIMEALKVSITAEDIQKSDSASADTDFDQAPFIIFFRSEKPPA